MVILLLSSNLRMYQLIPYITMAKEKFAPMSSPPFAPSGTPMQPRRLGLISPGIMA